MNDEPKKPLRILKDYNNERSNGADMLYEYFFDKVGIGADPEAPFTNFLEKIIDVFYNNAEGLANFLYDGVLNPRCASGIPDDLMRTAWLEKLGYDTGLPNKKNVFDLGREMTNDEYNAYLYLSNCRLRTVEDWRINFDKCFMDESITDIDTRIIYVPREGNILFNPSEKDTRDKLEFIFKLMKHLTEKNMIWEQKV